MSTTGSGRVQRLLDDQIEPFLQHLRDAGYAERTLRKKRTVARAFARWAHGKGIATQISPGISYPFSLPSLRRARPIRWGFPGRRTFALRSVSRA